MVAITTEQTQYPVPLHPVSLAAALDFVVESMVSVLLSPGETLDNGLTEVSVGFDITLNAVGSVSVVGLIVLFLKPHKL